MAAIYYSIFKEGAFIKIFSFILVFTLFTCFLQTPLSADGKHESLEEYRAQGLEAQQSGSWDDALAYYQKALSLDQNRADINNDLGIVCERMGKVYEAKNYYLTAISLDKYYLPAYSNLAYFYKRQGDVAQAVYYFKKRIELGDPQDPLRIN
ncbi:MAG: tetratricopeptide repeat protein [Candidatus Omnitrophica bacterium]|nr:tetratricopeptide repeat protein [Candidatus Omnitrophota bacterium]